MLSMFLLYIFLFIFHISFFLRDNNGNKSFPVGKYMRKNICAIPVTVDLLIVFRNSKTIL